MNSPDLISENPYRFTVPQSSPLYALRQAMGSGNAESAWGHAVKAMQQTAEEFYVLAISAETDRLKFNALKTYERLLREISRHFEWLAKRDQKDADRNARNLKTLTSENFAEAAVKTMAEGEKAKIPSGGSAATSPQSGEEFSPRPWGSRAEREGDAQPVETVPARESTGKQGTYPALSRRERRYLERQEMKSAKKAAKQAKRAEEKQAA